MEAQAEQNAKPVSLHKRYHLRTAALVVFSLAIVAFPLANLFIDHQPTLKVLIWFNAFGLGIYVASRATIWIAKSD